MEIKYVRNWLGLYFFLLTSFLFGFFLLCKETILLPISESEALSSLQIIFPVLIGQLTIIFKWYGANKNNNNQLIDIPSWVIKGPPIFVAILIFISVLNLIIGNYIGGANWTFSPGFFRYILTFCMTIINASTVYIVSRFFKI